MDNKNVPEQKAKTKDIVTNRVNNRIKALIEQGNFNLPENYSLGNAMNSAWVILNEAVDRNNTPVIQACSEMSISNALLDMAIQGLSPSKKQCYFIPYGRKLTLHRSYFGTQTVVKRILGEGTEIVPRLVYKGDQVEVEINDKGKMEVISHTTSIENINSGVIEGCYVKIYIGEKLLHTEYMSLAEIRVSWTMNMVAKGKTNSTQEKFPSEFAKRTVINRACKNAVNTSNDNDVLIDAFNKTTENEYKNVTPKQKKFKETGKGTDSLLQRIKEKEQEKVQEEYEYVEPDYIEPEEDEKEELVDTGVINKDGEILDDTNSELIDGERIPF